MSTGATTSLLETCRDFVQAVAWGEHHRVWDMLSSEGRKTVLRVATGRGMDEALAGRLREGTAPDEEREQFLTDLVNGLRADLQGSDVDALEYIEDPKRPTPDHVRVVLHVPLPAVLGGGGLPAAYLDLSEEDGRWRVERLVPRVGS